MIPHVLSLTIRTSDCPCCGGKVLAHDKPYRVHQVFELPETISDTRMGANLLSYIALQSGQVHQSVSQIQQPLKQHFGPGFSRGAISEAQGRVSAMLTPTHQAIKLQVQSVHRHPAGAAGQQYLSGLPPL